MPLEDAFRDGRFGVRLAVPEHFTRAGEGHDHVDLEDPESGVQWTLFLVPGLELDLRAPGDPSLRRDVERHTRWLFESERRRRAEAGERLAPPSPKKSPLVSMERVTAGGAPGLSTLHRMAYEPGLEIVLGHLVVPIDGALFEARWAVGSRMTGQRESALLLASLDRAGPDADPQAIMAALDADAPDHDAHFPESPLSRARAAEWWIREEAGLEVTAPAPARTRGEVTFPQAGFAFVPPGGFVPVPTLAPGVATLRRASFCSTDGIEWLIVERRPRGGELAELVLDVPAGHYTSSGVREVSARALEGQAGAAVVEGHGHDGPLRMVARGLADAAGHPVIAMLNTTPAQPAEELAAELATLVETFRLL